MLECVSDEEFEAGRRQNWELIQRGDLFNQGDGGNQFLVVDKNTDILRAVELNSNNIELLLSGGEYESVEYTYDEITIANASRPLGRGKSHWDEFAAPEADLGIDQGS